MDPAMQAAGASLAVSLTSAMAAFVLWRRRPVEGHAAPAVAAPVGRASSPVTTRAVTATDAFEWPPRDVDLFRYWSVVGSGLDSAARLMGASAMILWKVDASAGGLTPVEAYGYPAGVSHADPVATDARTLAEAAHADRCPRSRAMDGHWLVAVAVPVEHDGHLLGVLTAELRGDAGSADADVQAALARVAATLAPALAAGKVPEIAGVVVGDRGLTRHGARRPDTHTSV